MQTFLPYPDFERSARCLDRQRLGKQRVEALQILRTLLYGGGWRNHPAILMWQGHTFALALYGLAVCEEWRSRGYQDSCAMKICDEIRPWLGAGGLTAALTLPEWIGDRKFHRSHQSNLVRKLPSHYRPQFPRVPDDLPYVWPVSKEEVKS